MLFEPEPTPYDLKWRMFGVSVRVHPLFWLISAILGWDLVASRPGRPGGFSYLLLWVLCVFVSILLHELGHVFAGRLFGSHGYIVLYSMGGLAVGSSDLARRWQRIIVLFAGPGVQLLLYALLRYVLLYPLLAAQESEHPLPLPVLATYGFLLEINLYWPILNLLPIWPLDGGRITREVLDGLFPGRGTRASLGISLVVAGLLAVHGLMGSYGRGLIPYLPRGSMYSAILFGMLALMSYQAMQMESGQPRWERWDRDEDRWNR